MAPKAPPLRIVFHRKAANRLRRVATRRHLGAAWIAKRAMLANRRGHHLRARKLLRRALRLKALAARAGVRSRIHRLRIVQIRRALRLRAQRRAGPAR
jgi:hypothetical protein